MQCSREQYCTFHLIVNSNQINAELYQSLGLKDLGATLSCNRDFTLIKGFNPRISLTRTRTIMEGAAFCDFRYALDETPQRGKAG